MCMPISVSINKLNGKPDLVNFKCPHLSNVQDRERQTNKACGECVLHPACTCHGGAGRCDLLTPER